jgi:hypothetical protein
MVSGGKMAEVEQATDSAAQVTEVLRQLQHQLLRLALELADGLEEAIPDAPLNQRVSALKALIDGVLKLEARMPQTEPQEKVYRIEYQYPDGTIHRTPPWAEEDSGSAESVQRGRLWTAFRKDRIGEDRNS